MAIGAKGKMADLGDATGVQCFRTAGENCGGGGDEDGDEHYQGV